MARGGRSRKSRAEAPVRVDVNGASDAIGAQAGVSIAELESLDVRLRESLARLASEREEGRRPFLDLAEQRTELAAVLERAKELRGEVDWCVVVAGEGSGAGNRILADALFDGPGVPAPGRPGLILLDSADPVAVRGVLDRVDLRRTIFHVLARTGESVETLAAFVVLRDRLLSELGAVDYAHHLLLTTDADAGPLRQIVNDEGLHATEFPSGVGAHQAATSPAHLFGAALIGADVSAYLEGVRAMDARCREPDPFENPAALLAATYYLLATLHGVQTSVWMTYSDRLGGLAEWWRQLWASTLGKKAESESSSVSVGTTPVVARGTVDHHGQLQMYLDGPADKVVTFVGAADDGAPIDVPRSFADLDDVGFLGGRTLQELLALERGAVAWAFARAGRPTLSVDLPGTTPYALGQAVRLFEATALLCAFLHDVDPSARPAVEATRRLVFGALGKPGFEAEGEAVRRWREAGRERFVR